MRDKIIEVQKATGLLEPAAALLCARGIDTPDAAVQFLHPDTAQLHDPMRLPDMRESVQRIRRAIDEGERITVFCDYDADGTCGGSALYLCLVELGADVDIKTPNRHKEGYGLNTSAVDEIDSNDVTLIITVDCGITNLGETEYAKSRGMDVIITDHHECGEALPDTPYIINPKRSDSEYPCAYIAGCGVAFKLIQALTSLENAMRYIDLIAIGTITDIVPLLGENRAIAHLGIEKLRRDPSAGVAALAQAAGIDISAISSSGVSFGLGPRINAAGRMDTAEIAINILSATKKDAALAENAAALCALNNARKKDVDDIISGAEAAIHDRVYMKDAAILLADTRWNAGVIGIAAAKIAEKYTRPCVLFGGNGDGLIGSARSIPGINIYDVLGVFADRFEKFGGHAQAAGLTINPTILDDLRRDVCAYIDSTFDESVFDKKRVYDIALDPRDITRKLVADLMRLEPFGACNEMPRIAVFGADITATKFVGKADQPHLKFVMAKDGAGIDAISFYFKAAHSFTSRRCDFLCEASINDFNGKPQLVVRDTAIRFDKRLVDSFIKANKSHMIQHFLDEATRLIDMKDAMDEHAFSAALEQAMTQSRHGLCITCDTLPALMRLLEIDVVLDALKAGTLGFYDARAFSSGNCIACGGATGHDRILRAGVCASPAFFDEEMHQKYRQHAAQYYLGRDALLAFYRTLMGFAAKEPKTESEIIGALRITPEKAAFALQVLFELKLIERTKSGKILSLQNGGSKKELKQSACFSGVEGLMKEQ